MRFPESFQEKKLSPWIFRSRTTTAAARPPSWPAATTKPTVASPAGSTGPSPGGAGSLTWGPARAGTSITFSAAAGTVGVSSPAGPCRALVDEAERLYPAVRGRISQSSLPALEGIDDGRFGGVVASAVLMHLADGELKSSLCSLRRVLKGRGRLLVSLPVDEGGKARRGRGEEGRFFNGLSPERLETLLVEIGFACLDRGETEDSLGRPCRRWAVGLFAAPSPASA